MYARLITAHIQPTKLEEFASRFSQVILPAISREHGFKSIYVMKDAAQHKITALVMWENESDAQASIEGYLSQRLPQVANLLVSQPSAETLEVILRA
jgi:heme-degrading monooxygenase HmoA